MAYLVDHGPPPGRREAHPGAMACGGHARVPNFSPKSAENRAKGRPKGGPRPLAEAIEAVVGRVAALRAARRR